MDKVKDELYVNINYDSSDDHVTEIENEIKEWLRKYAVHNITDLIFRILIKLLLDIWLLKHSEN